MVAITAAAGCSGSTGRITKLNDATVTLAPTAVAQGSAVRITISGLGSDQMFVYLIPGAELSQLGQLASTGNLAVLGKVNASSDGTFTGEFVIPPSLPSSDGHRTIAITPGSWRLVLGNGHAEGTYEALQIEAVK
jgi:hypothetical protein